MALGEETDSKDPARRGSSLGNTKRDRIIEAIYKYGPINKTTLKSKVGDMSDKQFGLELEEIISEGHVHKYGEGKNTMYEIDHDLKDRTQEFVKSADCAIKKIEKAKNDFPKYAPSTRYAIQSYIRPILSLELDVQRQTARGRFNSISDDNYDHTYSDIMEMITTGQKSLHDDKLVAEKSVKEAIRNALDRGRCLREDLFECFRGAEEELKRTSGVSPRRRSIKVKKDYTETLECVVAELASRMRRDIMHAIGKAKSAANVKDDTSDNHASVHDDDVRRSDYGIKQFALDAYKEDLEAMHAKFMRNTGRNVSGEMREKTDAIVSAIDKARECACRTYIESLSKTGSVVYKAVQKVNDGITYCAIGEAVAGGRLKEPFSAEELDRACKHVRKEDVPGFLSRRSMDGKTKLLEEKDGRYTVVKALPMKIVDAVWYEPKA